MKKYLNKIMVSAGVVLLIICVFFGINKYFHSRQTKTETESVGIIDKKVEISSETIRYKMSNIGELCTAEYSYTHVERVDSSRQIKDFKIPFTSNSFIYSYDGIIKAGVDFTKIQVDKEDSEKLITVTIPKIKIITSEVDQESFKLYDEKNNIFNPIKVTDVTNAFADLKNSEEQKAIEKGLLDRAKANAESLIKTFVNEYDIEDYKIKIIFNNAETLEENP